MKTFYEQSSCRKAGTKEQDKEGAATGQDSGRGPRVQRCSAGTRMKEQKPDAGPGGAAKPQAAGIRQRRGRPGPPKPV